MNTFTVLTQTELLTRFQRRQRDTAEERWYDREVYEAINDALETWASRVYVPYVYTLDWSSQARQYTLPAYVRGPMDVQFQLSGEDFWHDFNTFEAFPTGGSGWLLTLGFYPPSVDGRIIYWQPNGPVPFEIPTVTTATLSSSGTSVVIAHTAAINVADNGFIKIDTEWIQYSGTALGTTTSTLSNLQRGCFGTTAASHTTTTSVYWGVAVHRADLYQQLQHQVIANLHSLYMVDGSPTELEKHQFQTRWHQQQADEYWRRYTPARSPKVRLSRAAIGDPYSPYYNSASDINYRYTSGT